MPIARGILKIDDYRRFAKLFEKMEEFGASEIAYFPKKGKIYVWFNRGDNTVAEDWLTIHGYDFEKKPGKNNNFVVLAIDWGG